MKIITLITILFLIFNIFLISCETKTKPQPILIEPKPITIEPQNSNPEDVNNIADANNNFAFDLYSKYKSNNENVFFSPYSISVALTMTYEGARGKTAEEMYDVLNLFPQCQCKKAPCICDQPDKRRQAFAEIMDSINKEDKAYKLSTANALWAQKDYVFLKDYFDIVETYYGGKVTNLDFIGDTENSRLTINRWIEDKTNSKIKDLIPQGSIDAYTRLVLTNAIYFKGTWLTQFDKSLTLERDFTKANGEKIKAKMMCLNHLDLGKKAFNYVENSDLQAIELPYAGEELSMIILLPKPDYSENMDLIEKNINTNYVNNLKSQMERLRMNSVCIPKFKFETNYFMADALSEMGMPTAFSRYADFSGMTGNNDLSISRVIHKAFIAVDEEGTEAAAATAVIMSKTSASIEPKRIFNADYPFIFMIQQKETGNILFMGKVADPTK
jgi:serpin B